MRRFMRWLNLTLWFGKYNVNLDLDWFRLTVGFVRSYMTDSASQDGAPWEFVIELSIDNPFYRP